MKIRLQKGRTIEEALLAALEYLKENEGAYPLIKGCATLYVTLQDERGKTSPNNDTEFVIDEAGMRNYDQLLAEEAKAKLFSDMELEIERLYTKENTLKKELAETEIRLRTAIERQFKTKEKWAASLKEKQEELEYFSAKEKPALDSLAEAFAGSKITFFVNMIERRLPYGEGKKKIATVAAVIHADIGDVAFFAKGMGRYSGSFAMVPDRWSPFGTQYIDYSK